MQAQGGKKYFIIEGNIGAGKSTFLKLMSNNIAINTLLEPHESWQNVDGENLFDRFYSQGTRWAYTFQTYVLVTRITKQERKAQQNNQEIQLLERSIYSDRYCFAQNCYELGFMNELEWSLYQHFFNWLITSHTLKPTGFIYLQTDPQICYQRLIKRSRVEELGVSLDYLQRLHEKHEAWLFDRDQSIPVLTLPGNDEFETKQEVQESYRSRIQEFLAVVS